MMDMQTNKTYNLQRHSHAPILVQLKNEIQTLDQDYLMQPVHDKYDSEGVDIPLTETQKKEQAR